MLKNIFPILSFLGISFVNFYATPALAEVDKNKYHSKTYKWDGAKVSNVHGADVSFDNEKRLVEGKSSKDNSYRMTWGKEEIDGSSVLTVTEASQTSIGPKDKIVSARTSTFSPTKLRSSTMCYGGVRKVSLSVTKTEMKCVTATKRSCQRLMEAYSQESGKNELLKGSQQQVAKVAQDCSGVLTSYKKMAQAFGNQTLQVEGRHNEVIESDTARVKAFVDQSTGSKFWEPTNIGSATTSAELDKMAASYASSIEGMQALTAALQVCADANADLQDDVAASAGPSAPVKQNGTAQ